MNTNRAMRRSWPWLLLAFGAVFVLATRLELSFDISAFFPSAPNLQDKVLLQQFQSGPGSRLIVIGLSGADAITLAEFSDELKLALADSLLFSAVMNGEFSEDPATVAEPVAAYYLLMQDIDFSADALREAIHGRLQDLAIGGGAAMLELVARDPYLASLDILQRLAPVEMSGDMWFAADGSAVLMAETKAAAVDIGGQAAAVSAVQEAISSIEGGAALTVELTGAGVFSVELQETIRAEARKRSILASAALILVLFLFFRRVSYLVLATVPIGMGFLVGLAVTSLLFETVHGITLAFGFTLMGVAIDFPLHLFSHAASSDGPSAIRRIWPTMRLGAISTAIAYLALAFSGSGGLAQLGVFTAAGIAIAVIATRTWVPYLMAGDVSSVTKGLVEHPARVTLWPALVATGLALVAINQLATDGLWDDRLASLSPVPPERLADDIRLRAAAGTPDMRHNLFIHNQSIETLLERGEDVDRLLANAVEDGIVAGWQSPTQLIPSSTTFAARKAALPNPDLLATHLKAALQGTPFRNDAFNEFANNVRAAGHLEPLLPGVFDGTRLQSWRDSRLVRLDDEWVALVALREPDVEELASRVNKWGDDVALLDLQSSALGMMQDYRGGALTTVGMAALLILALVWHQRRRLSQVLWIVMSVAAGLGLTVAVVAGLHGQLTVIHLVALFLVLGLGLDYALFLSRAESAADRAATERAVLACTASTSVAFGVLAMSSIPVLKHIGLTVAVGSVCNYLIAYSGTRMAISSR